MPETQNVLILGGGFAGWYAARRLAKLLPRQVAITVVDRVDHMLYTPMLTEVGGGTVQPQPIAVSHQSIPTRVQWINMEARSFNASNRSVQLADGRVLTAEHLVIALGAVTSYHNIEGAKENSISFKTLADANTARDRIDAMVNEAASLPHGPLRQSKLTLIVAGGGYTGVETMAALCARLKRQAAARQIPMNEVTAVLVEPMKRLMQEMPESLAIYGKQILERDGIRVLTGVGVTKVEKDRVFLTNGEVLEPGLLIWDTGIEPSPLLKDSGVPLGKRHGAIVDPTFRVPALSGVWAIGDCAEIPNPKDGKPYAATAQNAVREGAVLAKNIALVLSGKQPRPFKYKMLGQLALISEHDAVANILGISIRGFVAWLMWWIIYTAKLPGMSNRLRIIRKLL